MRCASRAARRTTCRRRSSWCARRLPTSRCSSSTSATRAATSGTQAFRPAVVEPVRHLVHRSEAVMQVLLDFIGLLNARAGRRSAYLVRARPEPAVDEFRRHLDVALHAKVLAKGERLVRAVRVFQQARGARRNAESLAVPVKRLERLQLAKPLARERIV